MAREITFKVQGKQKAALAVIFENLGDFADWFVTTSQTKRLISSGFGLPPQARAHLLTGDQALVKRSEALLDKIEAESPMANTRHENVRTVSGGLADVPAYLSGCPVNMRRRQRQETAAPLRIVMDVTSSAGIGQASLERRGVAALALMRRLEAAGHAVELWIATGLGEGAAASFTFTRMETTPLDIVRACWALASHEFSRQCGYSACQTNYGSGIGAWPWSNFQWYVDHAQEVYANALGVDASSILALPPIYGNQQTYFNSDAAAIKWVNETYAAALAQSLQDVR